MDEEIHTFVVAVLKRIDNGLDQIQLAVLGHLLI